MFTPFFLIQIISFLLLFPPVFPTPPQIWARARNLEEMYKTEPDPLTSSRGHGEQSKSESKFDISVRILVVLDSTMKHQHQSDLNQYVENLFDFVSKFYKNSTSALEHFVQMKVVKYHTVLDEDGFIMQENVNISKFNQSGENRSRSSNSVEALHLLERFCDWKASISAQSIFVEENEFDFDAAIFLTRRALHRKSVGGGGNETATVSDVLGVANYGSLCTSWSCAVIQDYSPYTLFSIIHELGHLLHMHDDESEYCQTSEPNNSKSFGKRAETGNESYVMQSTRYLEKMTQPDFQSTVKWSNCSKVYLKNFLQSSGSSCIRPSENDII